jgi:hypothetical protein
MKRGEGVHARVVEVAEFWDVSPGTVMRLCQRFERGEPGGLPFIRINRAVRIRWEDVDTFGRPSPKQAGQ